MSSARVTLLALVVLAIAGGAAWWALRDDGTGPADAPPPREEFIAPRVGTLEGAIQHVEQHEGWPYANFAAEIGMLREPVTTDPTSEFQLQKIVDVKIHKTPVDIHVKDATLRDVVSLLNEKVAKPQGLEVWSYEEDHEVDDVRFTLDFDQIPVENLIDELRGQSDERMKYYTTHRGLVLGGMGFIQRAQMEAREELALQRSKEDRDDPILDVEYRPDFEDASIAMLHRHISSQTKVQVVVDGELWRSVRSMSWRANPMPLRDALDVICKHFRCHFRVHEGRVFLISHTH